MIVKFRLLPLQLQDVVRHHLIKSESDGIKTNPTNTRRRQRKFQKWKNGFLVFSQVFAALEVVMIVGGGSQNAASLMKRDGFSLCLVCQECSAHPTRRDDGRVERHITNTTIFLCFSSVRAAEPAIAASNLIIQSTCNYLEGGWTGYMEVALVLNSWLSALCGSIRTDHASSSCAQKTTTLPAGVGVALQSPAAAASVQALNICSPINGQRVSWKSEDQIDLEGLVCISFLCEK